MNALIMMVFLQAAPVAGAAANGASPFLDIAGAAALGYVTQVVRAFKFVHTAWSYVLIAAAGTGIYWFFNRTHAGSEEWGAGLVMFLLASRGSASTVSDMKAAPKTDSL